VTERRRWPRVALAVEIAYAADCPPTRRQISDIGHGGVFVDTPTPLPEGTPVQLSFSIPGRAEPIEVEAAVAWRQPHLGIGLRFTKLAPREKAAMDRYVTETLGYSAPAILS